VLISALGAAAEAQLPEGGAAQGPTPRSPAGMGPGYRREMRSHGFYGASCVRKYIEFVGLQVKLVAFLWEVTRMWAFAQDETRHTPRF